MKKVPTFWLGLLFSVSVFAFAECEQSQVDEVIYLSGYTDVNTQDNLQVDCQVWSESAESIILAIGKFEDPINTVNSADDEHPIRYYNIHLIFFDVSTWKIKAQYARSYAYSFGDQDELTIELDLSPYYFTPKKRGFGLQISHTSRQNNIQSQKVTKDLFYLSDLAIQPILQGLLIDETILTDRDNCMGQFVQLKRQLSTQLSNISSLSDIIVAQTISSGNRVLFKQQCINKVQNQVERDYRISFSNGQYSVPDKLRYYAENLSSWVKSSLQ